MYKESFVVFLKFLTEIVMNHFKGAIMLANHVMSGNFSEKT